jgi:hypothetical protein
MVKNDENHDPELELELERLRSLDRELAAEVDRKTSELIRLRLAVAEAKRLALLRETEWRGRQGGERGYSLSRSYSRTCFISQKWD